MSEVARLIAELVMVFSTIAALTGFVGRVAWQVIYHVLGCSNPVGKTAAVSAAAIWLISAAVLALV